MTIRGVNQQRLDSPWQAYGWERWYSLTLIGKDKLPVLLKDFPNPIAPPPIDQTWVQRHVQFTGKDTLPFNQKDWPNPIPPFRIEQTVTWSQTRMFGQDKLPKNQSDWPNPNPGSDPASRRSWEFWYNLNLIGQDKLPKNQKDWPNPQPVTWYQSWEKVKQLTTVVTNPFIQTDWPNYRSVDWYRSWEAWYNLNLMGKDTIPFRNLYPNPDPVQWYRSWEHSQQLVVVVTNPFVQTDWPNYRPVIWYQDWNNQLVLNMPVFAPSNVTYWPVPPPVTWYQDWNQNLLLTTLFVVPPPPHNQYDWPNPTPNYRLDQTWINRYNLFGQDQLPNRQQDWPTPTPVQWYQNQGLNLVLVPYNVQPGRIPFLNFDWPNPRDYSRLSDYGYISFVVNPPLPTITQGGGWTEWTEGDEVAAKSFWKRKAELQNYYENIRKAAQELGSKGGQARMQTMTARERHTYAQKAAEARWKK